MNTECDVKLTAAKELLAQKNLYGFVSRMAVIKDCARMNEDQDLYWKVFQEEAASLQQFCNYPGLRQIVKDAKDIITKPERLGELQYLEGVSLVHLGEYDDARKLFQKLGEDTDERLSALGKIGLVWLETVIFGETGQELGVLSAESLCKKVLKLNIPEDLHGLALQLLGTIYLQQRRFKQALQVFEKVKEALANEKACTLNSLARAYLGMGELDHATQHVERAETVALKDGDVRQEAQSYLIRARIEEELVQDYTQAKEYYLVAYDKFLEVASLKDALLVMQKIANVDQQVNRENVVGLARQLGIRLALPGEPVVINWGQGVDMVPGTVWP